MDVWLAIARCLTGADLLHLARVSHWNSRNFSQDVYWRDRLALEDTLVRSGSSSVPSRHIRTSWCTWLMAPAIDGEVGPPTALQLYLRAYSFRFQGLCKYENREDRVAISLKYARSTPSSSGSARRSRSTCGSVFSMATAPESIPAPSCVRDTLAASSLARSPIRSD